MITSKNSSRQTSSSHFYPDIEMNFGDETSKSRESKDYELINDSFGSRTTTSKSLNDILDDKKEDSMDLDIVNVQENVAEPLGFDDEVKDIFVTEVTEASLMLSRNRRGLVLMERIKTQPENAVQVIDKVNNHHARDLYIEAEEYIMELRFGKALCCLHRAIHLLPSVALFYVQRGEIYLHLCDLNSAILNYKKACILEPQQKELFNRLAFLYYMLAQILYDQCLYVESLDSIARASEMKPKNIAYKIRSIACLAALRRHSECLALVNKHLQKHTSEDASHDSLHYADIYVLRARLHQRFSNISLCYYDVRDALRINNSHQEALVLMNEMLTTAVSLRTQAVQLKLMNRPVDALRKISNAIATNPSVAEFHIVRGSLNRNISDFNSAIDDYLMAMDKSGHCETNEIYMQAQRQLLLTYNDFAVECFQKSFFSEAIILLNKAIKGEKREPGLYINRGDCFLKESNIDFSLADYEQALEMTASINSSLTATIKKRIAIVNHSNGIKEFTNKNIEKSIEYFSKAIENDDTLALYYISRAKSLHLIACGNEYYIAKSREDLIKACKLDKEQPGIQALLSRLFPGKSIDEILQLGRSEINKLKPLPIITRDKGRIKVINIDEKEENIYDSKVKDTMMIRPDLRGHHIKVNDVMYPPKIYI